jgi:hypothetical protein
VHHLDDLRAASILLNLRQREKIAKLKDANHGITDDFLSTKLVPRYIVFIDEDKNIMKL